MDFIKKVKSLNSKGIIKFNRSGFRDCECKTIPDMQWINDEGYGSSAWAPTLIGTTRNFGLNAEGTDYIKTY